MTIFYAVKPWTCHFQVEPEDLPDMLPGVVSQQLITIIRSRDDPLYPQANEEIGCRTVQRSASRPKYLQAVERELSMMNTQNSSKETDAKEKHVSDNNSS
ncbi:hypothetical protein [Bradyrhizobium sp. CCBAU 11445]|uniref:hypothetical protein n=1 Tax=Bradyrhizobium sp. CCBAU 11445 TaxID=1630896 RepID=UPI0023063FA8|nr:hypothetical protein [Bradyrhizobium sp. CCBAU 11445]